MEKSAFADFQERFNAVCAEKLRGEDLRPSQRVDAWLPSLAAADDVLMGGVEKLRPFGLGNPEPVWGLKALQVVGQPRIVGEAHLKLVLGEGEAQRDAIAFRMGKRTVPPGPLDVVCALTRDEYRGASRLQLSIKDFHAAAE